MIILPYFALLFCSFSPLCATAQASHALLNKRLFTHIYERHCWGSSESRSGAGSTLRQTEKVRHELEALLKKWHITSLLDAPCGDFNWMKKVDISHLESYTGFDIVEGLIQENVKQYATPTRHFFTRDIVNEPLPQVDLILCRDCTQHLTDQDVYALFANIKRSKSRYLLTSTYPAIEKNNDIIEIYSTARITYRNLRLSPFNFPEPLYVIEEGFEAKVLALWDIDSLPDFSDA